MNNYFGMDYYYPETPDRPKTTYGFVRDCVTEFHKTTGQYIGSRSPNESPPEPVETMRENLIAEEREELLKEICDLAYVIAGADVEWGDNGSVERISQIELICSVLGMNFVEAFRRVHSNNVGRCIQDDGTIKRRDDGKIIRNPNYAKVDLSDLV